MKVKKSYLAIVCASMPTLIAGPMLYMLFSTPWTNSSDVLPTWLAVALLTIICAVSPYCIGATAYSLMTWSSSKEDKTVDMKRRTVVLTCIPMPVFVWGALLYKIFNTPLTSSLEFLPLWFELTLMVACVVAVSVFIGMGMFIVLTLPTDKDSG